MKKDSKNKILNQHLASLISKYSQSNVLDELAKAHNNIPIQTLPTEDIIDNYYVRKVILTPDKLKSFIENYQRNILLEPLVVRARDEKYEVIIGRKRLAAAKLAKITSIPVIVMNYNDEETLLILLAKFRDSQAGSVLELAYIFNRLVKDFGYSHQSLAKLAITSRPQVTNTLRILRLPPNALKALNLEQISFGHARALVTLEQENVDHHLDLIVKNKLSVRELEAILNKDGDKAFYKEDKYVIVNKNKVTIVFENEDSAAEFVKLKLK